MSSMAQNVDADRVNIRKNFTMPLLDTIAAALKIGEERTRPQDSLVWYWQGLRWVNLRGAIALKDTIPLFHIGAGAPALRPIYALNGALRASNWGAGYGWVPRLLADTTMVGDVDTTSIAYKQWVINQFSPGGPFSVGFRNGLSLVGSFAELGANPLLHNTTIDGGSTNYVMAFIGNGVNQVVNISNSGSGIAAQIQATSGEGLVVSSFSSLAADFDVVPTSTNTIVKAINIFRSTSGTAAVGMGTYIGYQLKDAGNFIEDAGALQYEWTDASHATFSSIFRLKGVTAGSALGSWMDVNSQTANFYGVGGSSISAIGGQLGATLTGSITGVLASGPIPFWGTNPSTVTNTIVDGLLIQRNGAYSGAVGVGLQIRLEHKNSAGAIVTAGILSNKFTTATAGSEVSQWDFLVNNGGAGQITKFSIGGAATFLTATRFQTAAGVVVASANNLTLGGDGNMFHISGTTTINAITVANWQAGSEITLIFDGSLTVKNNTAGGGGTAVMKLAGAVDFAATADDELTLSYDGIIFREKSRSVN